MNITSPAEYVRLAREQPELGLPPRAASHYPEFKGWDDYLSAPQKPKRAKQEVKPVNPELAERRLMQTLKNMFSEVENGENEEGGEADDLMGEASSGEAGGFPGAEEAASLLNPPRPHRGGRQTGRPQQRRQANARQIGRQVRQARIDLPYGEFKKIIQKYNVKTKAGYLRDRPIIMAAEGIKLPADPLGFYGEEWENWGAATGSGRKQIRKEDLPSLREFAAVIQKHAIRSSPEYQNKRKALEAKEGRPLPSSPEKFYRREWQGWGIVTGSGNSRRIKAKQAAPYRKFKEIMAQHGIQTSRGYKARRPELMEASGFALPSDPDRFYEKEWQGWGIVTGSGYIRVKAETALSYPQFKELVRQHVVKDAKDYTARRPNIIRASGHQLPGHPEEHYAEDWEGWSAVTGFKRQGHRSRDFPSYTRFKEIIRDYEILGPKDYNSRRKEIEAALQRAAAARRDSLSNNLQSYPWLYSAPDHIKIALPYRPQEHYTEDWEGWGIVAPASRRIIIKAENALPYPQFKEAVREHEIQGPEDYRRKRPDLIRRHGLLLPGHPHNVYPDWEGWETITGFERASQARNRRFPPYQRFKEILAAFHVSSGPNYLSRRKEIEAELRRRAGALQDLPPSHLSSHPYRHSAADHIKIALPYHAERAYQKDWEGWPRALP